MTDLAIAAHGLTKRFGEVEALAGIDLEVPTGSVFGMLGPNGAGKTTAVRILTTILQPDSGTAEVLGIDVQRHPQQVREHIGLAGQYAAVDENLTGRENLRLIGRLTHLPRPVIAERSAELLEGFGLTHAADRPVKTYSGGMRRRLDLAAALVHRPPVLFLDEPTTGLDIASRRDLWQVIEDLVAGGTTVLLTTQYLEEADRLADRLVVIDRGLVIAEGAAAELKAQVGRTVVDVRLDGPDSAARAARLLADAGHADATVADDTVELATPEGAATVVEVLRTLDAAGVTPTGITVREPSLDDVFLALTGRRAEAEADTDAGTATDTNAETDDGAEGPSQPGTPTVPVSQGAA
ncbi:MAG TPA: ATP-binding cassette domain-containing protein [Acidimicrobiales bacterium]|nr:ATP-binding cassette domain-containing protein [Acidimicrobiales bacterium]